MNIEQEWQLLNCQEPAPGLLKELVHLSPEKQKLLHQKFCEVLDEQESDDNEWAIINLMRFVKLFNPEDYFLPVLKEVKRIVLIEDEEDYEDTYYYNSLSCFLESFIGPQHESILREEWQNTEDEIWKLDLLAYLAKAHTKSPAIIEEMAKMWEDDVMLASSYLHDYPHPKLVDIAESYIEFQAPWYKYIWSKTKMRNLDLMDWIEATSAWAKAKFPEEDQKHDLSMTPLESVHNWISILSGTKKKGERDFDRLFEEYNKWKESKLERYFLSLLPEDWKDWILWPDISPEERADFQEALIEAGLFKFRSVPKNGPCPCGSGKKAKRCCHS